MLVLLIFVKVNIGVAAFAVAGLLFLFGVADDGKALKSLPWGTIVMVLAVGSLLNIVNKMGGIDLMSNALAKIMTKGTATPFMGISAALLSLVSSALGVVYPTMMPMCADIAAQVGGVNPVALMAAVGAGGSLSGISPLSTGGALAMAVANEVWMMENAIYSILSPEGFASILYKDSKKAPEAARVMKVTAADLKELGLIERIIPEEEPANTDTLYRIAGYMDRSMVKFMKKYQDMSGEELAEHRYERFRRM